MHVRSAVSRLGLGLRSLHAQTPSATSSYTPFAVLPRFDHYLAAFGAFATRPPSSSLCRGLPDPVPVILSDRTYFTPRMVYAEMHADLFEPAIEAKLLTVAMGTFVRVADYTAARVALHNFMEIPTTTAVQRAKVKAAVLNALACRMYFDRKPRQRHLVRYLLGGMSIHDSELRPWLLERPTAEDFCWDLSQLPWSSDSWIGLRFKTYTAEEIKDDLRPLAFILRQAQRILGGNVARSSPLYTREDERAVEEMDKLRIQALIQKAQTDAENRMKTEIARRLYLDLHGVFRQSGTSLEI
ncbi:hypothetical protein DFH06DRAFT_1204672 [Mycena polygramma]|nr:hypothetical protein DFH06DRAFT_1204672 [Mycena polygramma]